MKKEKEKTNWHCAKCDGANVPHHFRTCEKREITKGCPLCEALETIKQLEKEKELAAMR